MKKLFCLLLFIIAVISPLFEIPVVGFIDEMMAIFAMLYLFRQYNILDKYERWIIKLLLLLFFIGTAGTLNHHYQTDLYPISLDILACFKFYVCFLYARHTTLNYSDKDKIIIIKRINIILRPFVIAGFVCGIINFFTDIGMTYEMRFGLRTFKFIYLDSAHYSNLHYLFLLFLTAAYKIKRSRMNLLFIILSLITWTLTFKSRAILFVLIYSLLFFNIEIKRRKIKANIFTLSAIICLGLFVTSERLEETYSDDSQAPRALLLMCGIETLKENLPIGAGWGAYGTDMAAKYYSPLYYELGLDKGYGLSPDYPVYLHDNYWPAIMGEFGLFGILVLLVVFYNIYKLINRDYQSNSTAYMYALFALTTTLFASLPTSIFFQANTIFLFFLLPLINFNEVPQSSC